MKSVRSRVCHAKAAGERAAKQGRRAVVREDDEAAGGPFRHEPVRVREPLGKKGAEVPVDLREALAEVGEFLLGEHEQVEVGTCAHRRRGRLAGEERHLADRAAGGDAPHLVLVAVRAGDQHRRAALERDVELVRRVALGNHDGACLVVAALEVVEVPGELVRRDVLEEAHAVRDALPVAVVLGGRPLPAQATP